MDVVFIVVFIFFSFFPCTFLTGTSYFVTNEGRQNKSLQSSFDKTDRLKNKLNK